MSARITQFVNFFLMEYVILFFVYYSLKTLNTKVEGHPRKRYTFAWSLLAHKFTAYVPMNIVTSVELKMNKIILCLTM